MQLFTQCFKELSVGGITPPPPAPHRFAPALIECLINIIFQPDQSTSRDDFGMQLNLIKAPCMEHRATSTGTKRAECVCDTLTTHN